MSRRSETPGQAVDRVMAAKGPLTDPARFAIATPWSSSDLERIIAADIFGADREALNTRSAAMRIPALSRGVNLVKSTIGRFPLVAMVGDQTEPDTAQRLLGVHPWLWGNGGGLPWQLRDAWTVDDLIFYGWSCWWRDNEGSEIRDVQRIEQDDWFVDADNRVIVNGSPAGPADVIVFPGIHEGLLSYGRDTLDDTRALYRNVRARLQNPVQQLNLHQTGGTQLTDPEIDDLIARHAAARQGQNAGVGYTSEHIELQELGAAADSQLMIEARNAAAVECARLVGVHAGLVDATAPKASLNYETTSGRNQEFVDFDLALYMTPITARLSMPDVMPKAQEFAAFNLGDFTSLQPSPTGPALEG